LVQCIDAMNAYLSHASLGSFVSGLRLSEMKGRAVESMTTFDSTKESLLDDFLDFFKAREKALLDRVEAAMGKPIARELLQARVEEVDDYEDEEQTEDELVA
jgi:hypothetical protein